MEWVAIIDVAVGQSASSVVSPNVSLSFASGGLTVYFRRTYVTKVTIPWLSHWDDVVMVRRGCDLRRHRV